MTLELTFGSSAGMRGTLKLLNSVPGDMTVAELRKKFVEETILTDYKKLMKETGKRLSHWKTRIYAVLMEGILPEDQVRYAVDKIISDYAEKAKKDSYFNRNLSEWAAKIWFTPNLPQDLKLKMVESNHGYCGIPKNVQKLFNLYFPTWLAHYSYAVAFEEKENVPMFYNHDWFIEDQGEKGALIATPNHERTKVVLLPDIGNGGRGSAIPVDAGVKNVHEAISWMYQFNPREWKGFTKEV